MEHVHLAASHPGNQPMIHQQPAVAYLEIIMVYYSVELMSAHHPKPDVERHAAESRLVTQLRQALGGKAYVLTVKFRSHWPCIVK